MGASNHTGIKGSSDEGWTYDATGQPACHERKADEEEKTCAPDGARITKSLVAAHTVFVDKVDYENTEERADARDPICECDVHGRRVVRLVEWWMCVCGKNCSIEECPDSE
jgi:hypothetical protein